MRTSCNGCRVLRKGCSDDCVIRPCLQWMKSADAQANATVFLAKFYGRAGLLNLLNAGPDHLRPAIFQSLLYEACGRVVDPIYGSVGLLYSGQWHHCQLAVDAVLKGLPVMQLSPPSDLMTSSSSDHHHHPSSSAPPSHQIIVPPNFKLYDIRHMSLSKDMRHSPGTSIPTLVPTRPRGARAPPVDSDQFSINGGDRDEDEGEDDHSVEKHSIFSGESTDGSMVGQMCESHGVELDLTLGFNKYGDMRY